MSDSELSGSDHEDEEDIIVDDDEIDLEQVTYFRREFSIGRLEAPANPFTIFIFYQLLRLFTQFHTLFRVKPKMKTPRVRATKRMKI